MTINFDVQTHSDTYVENLKRKNVSWYGQDSDGNYCNNCPDFEYVDYSCINFPDWQQQCEVHETVTFKNRLGNLIEINQSIDGDEAINKVIYEYYVEILKDLEQRRLFDNLNRDQGLRIGVQMLDSRYEKFWSYGK